MSRTQIYTDTTYDPTSVRDILQVYHIHRTGEDTVWTGTSGWSVDAEFPANSRAQQWVSNYRRIPPFREPSRNHGYFSRPAGRDLVEGAFVVMMFSGVFVVSVSFNPSALCCFPD